MLSKHLKVIFSVTQLLILVVWVAHALAGQAQLTWNAPTTNTDGTPLADLAGYHLYYWQGSTGVPNSVDVGNTTNYTMTGLVAGANYAFAVTAYNTAGNESSDSNTVTLTIPVSPPVAVADTVSTPAGTPVTIAVLANDTDPNGYPLTIAAATQGAHGSVTISGTTVTYTPAANFLGTDSFTYTITDSLGASASATVTVAVIAELQLAAAGGTLHSPMAVGTDTALPTIQYVWVPNSSGNTLDFLQANGYAQYTFSVPKSDAYVIWGRVSPSTTGTGSFFLGLDVQGNGLITGVSPTTYQAATIHVGDTYYVDSTATITAMPTGLNGLVAIKTANADKKNTNATFLTFTLLQNATLYVAYDTKVPNVPSWLTASFTNTGQIIQTTNRPLAVWKKNVLAGGQMALPGNQYQEKGTVPSMYLVLLAFQGPAPYLVWNVTPPLESSSLPAPWGWDEAASDTTPVFFLNAGIHTLTIKQRESGTKLNSLVITNDFSLVPQN